MNINYPACRAAQRLQAQAESAWVSYSNNVYTGIPATQLTTAHENFIQGFTAAVELAEIAFNPANPQP